MPDPSQLDRERAPGAGLALLFVVLPVAWHVVSAGGPREPAAVARAHAPPAAVRLLFGGGLDPNTATAGELALLPGIGPARAQAIVAEAARKPFRAVADLDRVGGIGPGTIAKLAPWLEIEDVVADPGTTVQAPRSGANRAEDGPRTGPGPGRSQRDGDIAQ